MSSLSSDVFDIESRTNGGDAMPARLYIGMALAGAVAGHTYRMHPNGWWILGYFAVTLPGIMLSARSDNWLVSLLGYFMVVVPTGAIVGPYAAQYQLASVAQALVLTIGVTVSIGAA